MQAYPQFLAGALVGVLAAVVGALAIYLVLNAADRVRRRRREGEPAMILPGVFPGSRFPVQIARAARRGR